jgi:hypothetical protein
MAIPAKKQAFNGIDLNVTHYDTDELLAMFNLTDPTEDDIVRATSALINKAASDRLPKVAAFFQQAQDALLDELNQDANQEQGGEQDGEQYEEQAEEQDEEQAEEQDGKQAEEQAEEQGLDQEDNADQLGQWWRNQYLKQGDKVQASKPADRTNKIQVLQGNQHMPTKREKLGVNDSYVVPVTQGTLNPNLKNTVTRLVNLDSQYRQIITPNSENPLGPASPTNYTIDLTENLTNVLSIKLNSVQIPYAWYALDYTSGTNVLFYKLTSAATYTPFVVEPGNYTPSQLQAYMALQVPFNGTPFTIAYNANSGKMTITNTSASNYDVLFFAPNYSIPVTPALMTPEINDAIAASKLNSNLGWLMGYRGTNQVPPVPNQLLYRVQPVVSAPANAIVTEAVADTYGPKYLILVLDDYNQNHLNKGLVTIATNDTRLSLPSYFNPGIAVNCDASGTPNNPTYVQSAPRQLTQAQLYTINAINQNRNNTTTDRYTGPTTTDVLALIPVKTFSMLPGQPYIEFGSALQTNERVYFGPVNIERMKIQLIDDKGNILNMHGNDWSFTIISTHLYEY